MKIDSSIEKLQDFMIEHRRNLHKIPEICYQEFKTSSYIQKVLKDLGVNFQTVGTGIVAKIKGSNRSKTIGFRADMDALPIEELVECDYKSTHKGFMHACGHDGNTATLLGFTKYLTQHPPKDDVVLLFQPAEEGGMGAARMIESGLIEADVFYALHVDPKLELGKFETRAGAALAGVQDFTIIFEGKSRHASLHNGKEDAMLAAAKFISDAEVLNTDDFLFHIGKIEGGDATNIIAEKVAIKGTMRFFDLNDLEETFAKIDQIFLDIEKQGIGKSRIELEANRYMPVVNSESEVLKLKGIDGFCEADRSFGGEDFGFIIQKYTGVFVHVGAKTDGKYGLHSNKFTFDERALVYGVQIFKTLLD